MSSIKVTQIPNFTPTTKQLNVGDILINSYDGNAFIKQQQNKNQNIINLRSTGSSINTGSFVVDLNFSNPFLTATRGDNSTFERNLSTLVPISASYASTASYALSSSYALNGGVTQIIAGTNVILSPVGGTGIVTVNAILASTGSGVPNGPLYSLQFNNGGLFSGSSNFTLLNNNALYLTGSLNVSGSIIGNLTGTSSQATTASYALNGGVTQLLAGANITLSPSNGLGQVTITSTGGSGGSGNTATGSYGSFYSTQTQTNVASTARSMSLNVTDISNGVSISGSTSPFNTYIKVENPGVYDIQFSAQVDKTDSGTDEIWVWIRKNGTNISDSATSIQLVGNGAHYVAAWNFFVNAAANDYFQLMWYSPDANVRLHAESAFGVVPGIPSLIVTANRVDQFLSNTGSFSGSFTGQLFGTSSWSSNAVTASYIVTAQTASYVLNAVSSSFAVSSSRAVSSSFALSSSFAVSSSNTISSSYTLSSSYALSSSFALTSSFPWFQTGSNIAYVGGNVGIGVANPTTNLDLNGTFKTTGKVILNNTTGNNRPLEVSSNEIVVADFRNTGALSAYLDIIGGGGSSTQMRLGIFGSVIGFTRGSDNTPKLVLDASNNVGIGTISPTNRLHISASVNILKLESNATNHSMIQSIAAGGNAIDINNNSGSLEIITGTLTRLIIRNDGLGRFTNGLTVTGSLIAPTITGSLFGTSSWANNAISSSFALTASFVNNLNQAVTIGNITSTPSTENTLNVYPSFAGGTGEGGQILLAASGGLYSSASMLDTWQDQFRVLRGSNTGGSNAGLLYMNLQTGNTQFVGAVTASSYNGLPNDYLYVTLNTNQTIPFPQTWTNRDILFDTIAVIKGIPYNPITGIASLTGGKVYRITSRLAWSAAAAYLLQYSCYDSTNIQIGPTVEIVQSTNGSNNISDGTLDFIYTPAVNTDIKIRTTPAANAQSGEYIRGDLNTQLIIQQIA